MIPIDLSGRIAVVTGASGQLGRVMARTLAAAGADVAVHYYRDKESAEKLREELAGTGRRSGVYQADVRERDSVMAMRDAVKNELGDADIIVNNAFGGAKWLPVLEQTTETYELEFRVAALQNVYMAQAFVPAMIGKKWGRVIGISTECAFDCYPATSSYAGAKRAMGGVLRALAREVGGHRITVNEVAPGWTITEKERAGGVGDDAAYVKNVPLKRRGTDQDVANAVLFLASGLASFVTGLFLPVTGGKVMPRI